LTQTSTSYIMKQQTEKIYNTTNKEIAITPFGVDCEQFRPIKTNKTCTNNPIRIGTVKRMATQYGIATLIEAFAIIKSRHEGDIELVLVGGGPEEDELKMLAKRLNVDDYIDFVGPVIHHVVPEYLNSFDIYVALSTYESFGVAIIEASACGIPVVVSNAGGLPEVVVDETTGYIVPKNNPEEAADRILRLLNDPSLRMTMGEAGRKFVLDNYEWKENADRMERLYARVIDEYKRGRGVA
jgi:glycosyltransferase involved in cell wall biosynthesis